MALGLLRARKVKPLSHRRKQLRSNLWSRPRALCDADTAGRRFGEVWDAFVEVHIPAFDAAHPLLALGNGAGRAGPRADLTVCAEIIGSEALWLGCDQGHVCCDSCEPQARAEVAIDEGAMLS